MTEADAKHLDHHHRRTAQAILSHPVSHNIEWRRVISLLEALGELREEHNGKLRVTLGGETETIARPAGKDLSEQTVVDLRRMLAAAGITAEGLRERGDASSPSPPKERGARGHAESPPRDHGDGRWGEA